MTPVKIAKNAALLLLVIGLTACSSRYPKSEATPSQIPRQAQMMSQAISEFLTNGQDLQRQLINHPRWGNELEMELQPTYFAASGRYCRPFILYPQDGEAQHRLA